MPLAPPASVTHKLPSGSSVEPCGKINMPMPNALRSLPEGSNFRIGGSLRPAQELLKQRCTTKTVPSRAGSTAVTAAHFAVPGGSSPQSRVVRYGCGRSLRGGPDCAHALLAQAAAASARIGVIHGDARVDVGVDRVMGSSSLSHSHWLSIAETISGRSVSALRP